MNVIKIPVHLDITADVCSGSSDSQGLSIISGSYVRALTTSEEISFATDVDTEGEEITVPSGNWIVYARSIFVPGYPSDFDWNTEYVNLQPEVTNFRIEVDGELRPEFAESYSCGERGPAYKGKLLGTNGRYAEMNYLIKLDAEAKFNLLTGYYVYPIYQEDLSKTQRYYDSKIVTEYRLIKVG